MDGELLVQLFLLSKMRASALVQDALSNIGANPADFETARLETKRIGLNRPGHPMRLYSALLGVDPQEERHTVDDPYKQLLHYYHLPLWPDLRFTVMGSLRGETSGVAFNSALPTTDLSANLIQELIPWHTVESQITSILCQCTVSDEWYPQKDYTCAPFRARGEAAKKVILHFDFGLLQNVLREEFHG